MEIGQLYLLLWSFVVMNVHVHVHAETFVRSSLVKNAIERGAVCLDGKPPSYNYDEGSEDGSNNWIVYMEGGGWCTSKDDCKWRSGMYLGNSNRGVVRFSGLLNDDIEFNPDFYNWNKVFVHYCDGSSFMSNIEKVDPETKIRYRGARIYEIVMEELLALGLRTAENAILAGSSAGGLTTILYCDMFRALLPNARRVKCIADSGFFIHGKDLIGVELREQNFSHAVITQHDIANSLPTTCTSKMNPELCIFPENLVGDIKTPLFIIESAFDAYQIKQNVAPAAGGSDDWYICTRNLTLCTATQIEVMKDFRRAFIETLTKLDKSSNRGMFVHSCYRHTHIHERDGWTSSSIAGNVLANKSIGEAVSDWYFDRSPFYEIDTKRESPWNCTKNIGL